MISGYCSFRGFETFSNENASIGGAVSRSTFQRVLGNMDLTSFKTHLFEWVISIVKANGYDFDKSIVSIDGKAYRAHNTTVPNNTYSLNMFIQDFKILLDSVTYEGRKTYEIEGLKKALNNDLIKLVTADALHTNQHTLRHVIGLGKDYLFASKQKKLNLELELHGSEIEAGICNDKLITLFAIEKGFNVTTTYNKSYTYKSKKILKSGKKGKDVVIKTCFNKTTWDNCGIATMIKVEGLYKDKKYIRYYITSLDSTDEKYDKRYIPKTNKIEYYEKTIRERWGVEEHHRSIDMVFKEDHHYTKNISSATFFNLLSSFTISVFRLNGLKTTEKTVKRFCNRIPESMNLLGIKECPA